MKVFTINSRMVDGKPQTSQLTCSLSIDEVKFIVLACERMKPQSNEVVESLRTGIIETLKDY